MQNYQPLVSGTTQFGQLYGILNNNMDALRSSFSGTAFPADPTVGQPCYRTDVAPPVLYLYNGTAWEDFGKASPAVLAAASELLAARGSAASLAARLSIAINPDGTLKGSVPVSDWWTEEPDAVTRIDGTSFYTSGDKTAVYLPKRALLLNQTVDDTVYVVSATYSSGTNRTTVTVEGGTVDTGLTGVSYGQPDGNQPKTDVAIATASVPGLVKPGTGLTVDGAGALSVVSVGVHYPPQTIVKCKQKAQQAAPFDDLSLPDFLTFAALVVTLNADGTNPFAACFGNGDSSVFAQTVANMTHTVGSASGTLWLYLERNVSTGALTLGSSVIPPEYNSGSRKGVQVPNNFSGYTNSQGTVSATSEYAGGGSPAWKAMDGNSVNAAWYSASGVTNATWQITFPSKRRVRGYKMTCENDALAIPRAWNVKVTNNSVETTVDTVTGATWGANETKTRYFANPVDADLLKVECLNSGREYTGITEIVFIYEEDFYDIASNVLYKRDGTVAQRVYIGKVAVNGGAITSVVPFHPGVTAVVPMNNSADLVAGTVYSEHNPLGVPLIAPSIEGYEPSAKVWDILERTGYSTTVYGPGVQFSQDYIRIHATGTYAGYIFGGTSNLAWNKARMRCRRSF